MAKIISMRQKNYLFSRNRYSMKPFFIVIEKCYNNLHSSYNDEKKSQIVFHFLCPFDSRHKSYGENQLTVQGF